MLRAFEKMLHVSLRPDGPSGCSFFGGQFSAYGWHRRLEAVTAPRLIFLYLKAALWRKLLKLGCQPEHKKSTLQKAAAIRAVWAQRYLCFTA